VALEAQAVHQEAELVVQAVHQEAELVVQAVHQEAELVVHLELVQPVQVVQQDQQVHQALLVQVVKHVLNIF
jgi:hypothetical protein